MADPLSLALVGGTVLTEGIKFLYGQLSKILERRAARKEAEEKAASDDSASARTEPAQVQLPAAFEGQLTSPQVDFEAVEQQLPTIRALRSQLVNYSDGVLRIDPQNQEVITAIDNLRQVLESIYGQTITFKGENRPPSGVKVTTEARADVVAGKFTGTRIQGGDKGEYNTKIEVGRVEEDGEVIGTDHKN